MRTRHLVGLLLLLTIPTTTLAGGSRHADPPLAFSPVPDYGPRLGPVRASVERIRDVPPMEVRSLRPDLLTPPRVEQGGGHRQAVPQPRPVPVSRDRQRSVTGTASWYCGHGSACAKGYPGGLYAAAGPSLRTGRWRGRKVDVVVGGRMVTVRLIDWCACPKRIIDLYSDAFSRLAPLNRGLLKVEVTW